MSERERGRENASLGQRSHKKRFATFVSMLFFVGLFVSFMCVPVNCAVWWSRSKVVCFVRVIAQFTLLPFSYSLDRLLLIRTPWRCQGQQIIKHEQNQNNKHRFQELTF